MTDYYRIFEAQWKQPILLWLGRKDVAKEKKEEFIKALVEFQDGCGKWSRKHVDKGFYEYRAYFLAAAGIGEFGDCSQSDEIVGKIVKWCFGYFNAKKQELVEFFGEISEEADTALQQTQRTKAINALVQLLSNTDVDDDTRRLAADSLGEILGDNDLTSVVTALKGNLNPFKAFDKHVYNILWQCAQNQPYPAFYQAWHNGDTLISALLRWLC